MLRKVNVTEKGNYQFYDAPDADYKLKKFCKNVVIVEHLVRRFTSKYKKLKSII